MSRINTELDLKKQLPSEQFSEVVRKISSVIGIKPMAFRIIPIKLFRLGFYTLPSLGVTVDLSEYFIDIEGSMYSRNTHTYFTEYGRLLEKLSDNSYNSSGVLVNSFRSSTGKKVTIRRQYLKNMMHMGMLEDVTGMAYSEVIKEENNQAQAV